MVLAAVFGLVGALTLAGALLAGVALGHRRGVAAGRVDALRRLVRAKDQECWTAAHYLEADLVAEIETQTIRRARPRPSGQVNP